MTQVGEGIFAGIFGDDDTAKSDENWVDLVYVDSNDKPVGGARYVVLDANDNELASGKLDNNGFAHVALPPDVAVIRYYFEDDPKKYEIDKEYQPVPNPHYEEQGFWATVDLKMEETGRAIKDAAFWTWGVLQGDFNENPTIGQIIARMGLTVIPVVDQIADLEDIVAALKKLIFDGRVNDAGVWFDLVITLMGCIPEIGSVLKAIAKALKVEAKAMDIFKLVRKLNWAGSGNVVRFLKKLSKDLPQYAKQVTDLAKNIFDAIEKRLCALKEYVTDGIGVSIDQMVSVVREAKKLAPKCVQEVFDFVKKKLDEVLQSATHRIRSGGTKRKHKYVQEKEPWSSSALVEGGGLAAHEKKGGHLLDKHVGKTNDYLRDRLVKEPDRTVVSTFTERAEAERAASKVLDDNADKIDDWLKSGSKNKKAFKTSFEGGRVLKRGDDAVKTGKEAILVLKPDGKGGFFILTGYPGL